jgi:hypothetical protein
MWHYQEWELGFGYNHILLFYMGREKSDAQKWRRYVGNLRRKQNFKGIIIEEIITNHSVEIENGTHKQKEFVENKKKVQWNIRATDS